jgi:hypothetical protein
MSGVAIVGELLRGDQGLTAMLPVTAIVAWVLPQGSAANALVLSRVSRTELQLLAGEAKRRVTERVQVTIRAKSGRERTLIERLARIATADKIGTIADFEGVAVLLAGGGPDIMDDAASIFLSSFDLRVSFLEPA